MSIVTDAPRLHDDRLHDDRLQAEVRRIGFFAALDVHTHSARSRVAARMGDLAATASPAAYTAWLRRVAHAWNEIALPTPAEAAVAWPLTTVRRDCLDMAGVAAADLRSLAPGVCAGLRPRQLGNADEATFAAAAYTCVAAAHTAAPLLDSAFAVAKPDSMRYLLRCDEIDEQRHTARADLSAWATSAGVFAADIAILVASDLLRALADALEAHRQIGW